MVSCPVRLAPSTSPASGPALQRLVQWSQELLGGNASIEDLSELESTARELTMAVEREFIAAWLQSKNFDAPVILIDGIPHTRAITSQTTAHTAAGDIQITRTLYRRAPGEPCQDPIALQAGLIDGRWTPVAAKQAIWATAHLTPQDAANFFEMIGCMVPSKSALDRLPKRVSAQWEGNRSIFEAQLRDTAVNPDKAVTICISLDGVMAPMKDGKRAQKRMQAIKKGKKPCGPAGYREVGCGTISFYDADGGRLQTWRQGRMPQKNKRDLKDWLAAEIGLVIRHRPDLRVVKVSDGALDNWTFLDSAQMPDGVCLVDFFHAAGHLSAALASAYGEGTARYRARFATLRRRLRDEVDGVEKLIRSLHYLRRKHPRRQLIRRELRYFRRYRRHMRYAQALEQGLPIGSGVVEAACKTLMEAAGVNPQDALDRLIMTTAGQEDQMALNQLAEAWRSGCSCPSCRIPGRRRRPMP